MKSKVKHSDSALFHVPTELTEELVSRIMGLRSTVKADYLKSSFMSKYVSPDTDPPELRRSRAIEKWLACEVKNEQTNERLQLTHEEFNILPRVPYGVFMNFCRGLVEEIMGVTPPIEALIGSFSGGASTSRKRTESHPASKYVGKAHVTARCMEWFDLLKDELPLWLADNTDLQPEVVVGNVMFTVPKKTDIDRVACKEPDLNMFIQKGIGFHLRRNLRRIGINLNDQSINRSLAHRGSVDKSLATLDLSSASDSVTTELVFQMLPVTWYNLLDSVRSHVTVIDGDAHRNEMFSSMGNGFTFELESLLFYVLTRAVCYFRGFRGIVSVYGDDIICPADASLDLMWVLSYFGFEVNTEKSFWEGDFRESCGGHYYNGFDITPFYVRKPIDSLIDLIHVANSLRKWAELTVGTVTCPWTVLDPEVEDIWLWLKSFVPSILWGGANLSFKYQLVSQDTPHSRLVEESTKRGAGTGAYLHWHNAAWNRNHVDEGIETSTLSVPTGVTRIRRARDKVTRLHSLFFHEIVKTPGQ